MSADTKWMHQAIALAKHADDLGEIPVGAVIVHNNVAIAKGWNSSITNHDPTAHAEINAIRQAAASIRNYRLTDMQLYVTMEPCVMCLGAILHSRIRKVFFGCFDNQRIKKLNELNLIEYANTDGRLYQGGILADDCSKLVHNFFQSKRS